MEAECPDPQPESHLDEVVSVLSELKAPSASFFFFGCTASSLLRGLSLVGASGDYSSMWCAGFSLRWLLLVWSTGSRRVDFSSCGTQAQ